MEDILTTEDVQEILKLSRRQVIALMKSESFPSCRIGSEYRVTKEALQKWFDNTKSVQLKY